MVYCVDLLSCFCGHSPLYHCHEFSRRPASSSSPNSSTGAAKSTVRGELSLETPFHRPASPPRSSMTLRADIEDWLHRIKHSPKIPVLRHTSPGTMSTECHKKGSDLRLDANSAPPRTALPALAPTSMPSLTTNSDVSSMATTTQLTKMEDSRSNVDSASERPAASSAPSWTRTVDRPRQTVEMYALRQAWIVVSAADEQALDGTLAVASVSRSPKKTPGRPSSARGIAKNDKGPKDSLIATHSESPRRSRSLSTAVPSGTQQRSTPRAPGPHPSTSYRIAESQSTFERPCYIPHQYSSVSGRTSPSAHLRAHSATPRDSAPVPTRAPAIASRIQPRQFLVPKSNARPASSPSLSSHPLPDSPARRSDVTVLKYLLSEPSCSSSPPPESESSQMATSSPYLPARTRYRG
ncbi:hypothetical protein B0H11DRAFT_2020614 [Mycena galericulata]|nr:hypothetical protein B0H11DRAFT_2020614 [Mycena galericulata]